MRRLFAALTAFMMIFTYYCSPAFGARSWLYAEYDPPSERGSLFYVDIVAERELSAADIELRFDSSLAEYRSVDAEGSGSVVGAKADGDVIRIIFADKSGISGTLCRLTFKELDTGTLSFKLRMTEGVDSELNKISPPEEYTFTAELSSGSKSSSSSRSAKQSSASDKSSYSGAKSSKTRTADDPESTAGEQERGYRDLSKSRDMSWFLLGAGAALLVVLLVILGIVIGRGTVNKKKPTESSAQSDETE